MFNVTFLHIISHIGDILIYGNEDLEKDFQAFGCCYKELDGKSVPLIQCHV